MTGAGPYIGAGAAAASLVSGGDGTTGAGPYMGAGAAGPHALVAVAPRKRRAARESVRLEDASDELQRARSAGTAPSQKGHRASPALPAVARSSLLASPMRAMLWLCALPALACNQGPPTSTSDAAAAAPAPTSVDSARARQLRERLVSSLIAEGDLEEGPTADAMRRVPRHAFVPGASLEAAYGNFPLPIGSGQTISQPAVVATMTRALEVSRDDSVLEIGTGSGYQAAILSLLVRDVFTIEIVPSLADRARQRLAELGYTNVHVRTGDGYAGWPQHAPFARIIVTAAPASLPQALLDQLTPGGVLVAPIGPNERDQRLLRYRKGGDGGVRIEDLGAVAFVPMVSTPP